MDKKKNVILVGNGLNRISNTGKSWSELLSDIGKTPYPKALNTLQYEYIRLKNLSGEVNGNKTVDDVELESKKKIAEWSDTIGANDLHRVLVELDVSDFLTTNYDYALEDALSENDYNFDETKSCHDEEKFNLRRYNYLTKDDDVKKIWHIHGDKKHPASILVGFNHYCGTVGKIDSYLKMGYEVTDKPEIEGREPFIIKGGYEKRFPECDVNDAKLWIPLFFTANIHIIGLSMDDAETDLWWILDRRKRFMLKPDNAGKISNHIFTMVNPMKIS